LLIAEDDAELVGSSGELVERLAAARQHVVERGARLAHDRDLDRGALGAVGDRCERVS
jgi:hypothetical protein